MKLMPCGGMDPKMPSSSSKKGSMMGMTAMMSGTTKMTTAMKVKMVGNKNM